MGSPGAATILTDAAAELLAAHDRVQSPLEEDASIVRTPPATSQSPCASQHVHAASPVPSCSLAVPYAAQAEDATQACFFAATRTFEQHGKTSTKRPSGTRCKIRKESLAIIRMLGGFSKPSGVQPRGCTWDYKCGLWRYENGTPEARPTKQNVTTPLTDGHVDIAV